MSSAADPLALQMPANFGGPGGGGGGTVALYGDGSAGAFVLGAPNVAQAQILNATTIEITAGAVPLSPPLIGWLVFRANVSITVRAGAVLDGSALSFFIPAGKESANDQAHIGAGTGPGAGGGGGGGGGTLAAGGNAGDGDSGVSLFNGYLPGGGAADGVGGLGGAPGLPGAPGTPGTAAAVGAVLPSYLSAGALYPAGWAGLIQGGFQGALNTFSGGGGGQGGDAGAGAPGAGGFGGTTGKGGASILLIAPSIVIEAGAILRSEGEAGGPATNGAVGLPAAPASGAGGGGGGGGGAGGNGGCGGLILFAHAAGGLSNLGAVSVAGGLGGLGGLGAAGGAGDGAGAAGGPAAAGAGGTVGTAGIVLDVAIS
jgi:hypothetical protein